MTPELHRLLGLPPEVDVDKLRRVYEEQMAAAARSHDHTRALQLSNALDNAPASIRSAMYPRMTTRVGPIGAEPVGTRTRTLARTRRPVRTASRSGRSSGRTLRPILIMVVVAGAVVGVAWLNRDRFTSPSTNYVPPRLTHRSPAGPVLPSHSGFVDSALRDAHKFVQGVRSCRRIGSGALPDSTTGRREQATLNCGTATLELDLEPGNTVEYERTARDAFRVIVTAADGEFVTYNSRTGSYSG